MTMPTSDFRRFLGTKASAYSDDQLNAILAKTRPGRDITQTSALPEQRTPTPPAPPEKPLPSQPTFKEDRPEPQPDSAKHLAEMTARHWNELLAAGLDVPVDEAEAVDDELSGTNWIIQWEKDEWEAVEVPEQFYAEEGRDA